MRDADDIIGAHKLFDEKDANSVISVCETKHSPLRSNIIKPGLSMEHFAETDNIVSCRQQLPTYYRLNGANYIVTDKVLNNINSMYTNKCYAYVMKQSHSVDIDSELNFIIVEAIMNAK